MNVIREAFSDALYPRRLAFHGQTAHLILTPCVFLWGYLKFKVYQGKPRTIPELKEATQREIEAIPVTNWPMWNETSTIVGKNASRLKDAIYQE